MKNMFSLLSLLTLSLGAFAQDYSDYQIPEVIIEKGAIGNDSYGADYIVFKGRINLYESARSRNLDPKANISVALGVEYGEASGPVLGIGANGLRMKKFANSNAAVRIGAHFGLLDGEAIGLKRGSQLDGTALEIGPAIRIGKVLTASAYGSLGFLKATGRFNDERGLQDEEKVSISGYEVGIEVEGRLVIGELRVRVSQRTPFEGQNPDGNAELKNKMTKVEAEIIIPLGKRISFTGGYYDANVDYTVTPSGTNHLEQRRWDIDRARAGFRIRF